MHPQEIIDAYINRLRAIAVHKGSLAEATKISKECPNLTIEQLVYFRNRLQDLVNEGKDYIEELSGLPKGEH